MGIGQCYVSRTLLSPMIIRHSSLYVMCYYCNILIDIGRMLATWLTNRAFSQMVSTSAS